MEERARVTATKWCVAAREGLASPRGEGES
jgi:hypothetical protein